MGHERTVCHLNSFTLSEGEYIGLPVKLTMYSLGHRKNQIVNYLGDPARMRKTPETDLAGLTFQPVVDYLTKGHHDDVELVKSGTNEAGTIERDSIERNDPPGLPQFDLLPDQHWPNQQIRCPTFQTLFWTPLTTIGITPIPYLSRLDILKRSK